jgi:hypothetical protein
MRRFLCVGLSASLMALGGNAGFAAPPPLSAAPNPPPPAPVVSGNATPQLIITRPPSGNNKQKAAIYQNLLGPVGGVEVPADDKLSTEYAAAISAVCDGGYRYQADNEHLDAVPVLATGVLGTVVTVGVDLVVKVADQIATNVTKGYVKSWATAPDNAAFWQDGDASEEAVIAVAPGVPGSRPEAPDAQAKLSPAVNCFRITRTEQVDVGGQKVAKLVFDLIGQVKVSNQFVQVRPLGLYYGKRSVPMTR